MIPLTWQMVVDAAAESIGATKTEIMAAIKQPLHPAGLRDEFAVAALQSPQLAPPGDSLSYDDAARCAYALADAMMEARNANR